MTVQKKHFHKTIPVIIAVFICTVLTGCCLTHDWQEASCTAPKTCSKCKETQGTLLAHSWMDATCAAPRTCTVCNITEGDALLHHFQPANYQSPATCMVCQATEGEALPADFETYGLICQTDTSQTHSYTTACYSRKDLTTTGLATFSYQIVTSDDTHHAREGYEWQFVTIEILFNDTNAWNYGVSTAVCMEDYYDIKLHDDSLLDTSHNSKTYTVNWNGVDYTQCESISHSYWSDWSDDMTITYTIDMAFCLPIDYDGNVVGLRNAAITWQEGQYIHDVADETCVFFRIQ